MAPRCDCLCAGIIVVDHVCAPIDHLPAAGELVTTPALKLTIGGCASNVAVDLARLGHSVQVAGVVGDDVFGQFARSVLREAGVDDGLLETSAQRETSGTLVLNVKGEDRRFVHSIGANAEFTGSTLTAEILARCRVVYVGGYGLADHPSAEEVAALFDRARQSGAVTVLDVVLPGPADYWPLLEPVLPLTDVFLPNDDEARLITGLNDPPAQAERFRQAGAKTVGITCGGRGAVLLSEGLAIRAEAFPVEFVDGTGSGDAFVAGFIHGLLAGADWPACLRMASAMGASCVRAAGATTGVFNRDELDAFLAQHDLAIETL